MTHVWLAQCKCPAGHAILASAAEADELTAGKLVLEPLRQQVSRLLAIRTLNPWCGLCQARVDTWRYELGRTRWATMAEALPTLAQSEAAQIAAADAFGDIKRSD